MKWTISLLAIISAVFSAGCAPTLPKKVSLHGVNYMFPKSDIKAGVYPPKNSLFVRLSPKGAKFHLILDELSHYSPNWQGPNVPTISRLNDIRFKHFTMKQSAAGLVICKEDAQPHFNCGFRIYDGLVRWSVLFDRENLESADEIDSQAKAAIRAYRTSA